MNKLLLLALLSFVLIALTDADEVERCKMKMESIRNMSDVCTGKTGAEACTCWSDAKFTEYTADIIIVQ